VATEATERDWLGEGLARVVALRLQALSHLKVKVPPPEAAPLDTALERLRTGGYDVAVLGKFHQVETVLRAEVQLWLTQPERQLGKAVEQSSERDPDALGMKIASFLAAVLQANSSEPEARRVGERYTNSAEAYERFARALIVSEAASTEDDLNRAVTFLREAYSLDGRFVMALRQLGDLQLRTGHYGSAVETYQTYLSQGRRNAAVYRLLGNAYFAQHDVSQAIEAYRRGLQLDPRESRLHVDLGLAYMANKDYENAMKALLRALEVKADDPLAFANLGVVYLLQGNFAAATSSLRRAQGLQGSNASLAYNLGLSLMFEGAYDLAHEQFERALELQPGYMAAAYQQALLSERVEPDRAVERWQRYGALAAGHPDEEAWLAYAQKRLERRPQP
jgi:tetratricopeptide (TPR) repeat protein